MDNQPQPRQRARRRNSIVRTNIEEHQQQSLQQQWSHHRPARSPPSPSPSPPPRRSADSPLGFEHPRRTADSPLGFEQRSSSPILQHQSYDDKHSSHLMRILILVGPKGSGKTHIGHLIEREVLNATFLDVEQIAIDFVEKNGGCASEIWKSSSMRSLFFDQVRNKMQEVVDNTSTLQHHEGSVLIMETTGAAPEAKVFLDDIGKQFGNALLIRVRSSAETCAKRIQGRDASKHVDVSTDMIRAVHAGTEALDWDWDLELDNEQSLPEREIIAKIAMALAA